MQTFVSLETLSRRVNRCGATLRSRIVDGTITPDAIVIAGAKEMMVFDSANLPAIRAALNPKNEPAVIV